MTDKVVEYKEVGYEELMEDQDAHILFKNWENGGTWLMAFSDDINGQHQQGIYLTEKQTQELASKLLETLIKNGKSIPYVLSSIEGKGTHVGSIKGIGLDVHDCLIIETDIESISSTN